MAVDTRGIEVALVKVVRATIGDEFLSSTSSPVSIWDTFELGLVTNVNHIFSSTTVALAEDLRDVYFTANPSELILNVECSLVSTGSEVIKQKYTNSKPSVIRSRIYATGSSGTTPTFPDYPYASVDYTRITDEGYELTERYFDEDENYIYRTHKLASYSIKIFGTSKDDVTKISDTMHMMFETDGTRGMLSTLSPNEARVRSKSDVVFISSNMEDKYREVASFDVILAVLDEVVIPAGGVGIIDNVVFDTTVPQSGIQGGLFKEDTSITQGFDVAVETKVTYS